MPGTFAHMTLVNALCAESLDVIPGLNRATKDALELFQNYCELGSTSPDYPSLTILDKSAARWANVMHYYKSADLIRDGIYYLINHPPLDPQDQQRCVAWLFGYTAHVVADLTVHPVIAMKVGCYEGHEDQHRRCELHQDVYIFNRILREDVCSAEYLRHAGIMTCTENGVLNRAITALWLGVLNAIPRSDISLRLGVKSPTKDPEPNEWHTWFTRLLDKVAEEGGRLPALARRLGEDALVLLYPRLDELDRTYIDDLTSPSDEPTSYDAVFERAQGNVMHYWGELGAAIQDRNPKLFTLPNADLDTGVAESAPLFWSTT
jgi:hypothetical protein